MKISHEVPLDLLEESKSFNDYDYGLPLFWKYSEYRQYYIDARKAGRFIIMDNGLFEGETHTEKELIEICQLIEPDIFIVPDTWNTRSATYRSAKYWMNVFSAQLPKRTKLMVVLQGINISEMSLLYQQCEDLGYEHFAFNHSSEAYKTKGNMLIGKMLGRMNTINHLYNKDILKPGYYHHLLGASLIDEFRYYKDFDFIKSLDTSNPVIHGFFYGQYQMPFPVFKSKYKIKEIMDLQLDEDTRNIIMANIKAFRRFVETNYTVEEK